MNVYAIRAIYRFEMARTFRTPVIAVSARSVTRLLL